MLQSLMCLVTLIITSQHVHSTVIIINTTGGSDNTTCCVDGECDCSSLSTALRYITSSTAINITSQVVELNNTITMGSAYGSSMLSPLLNIKICGLDAATIKCNNRGSVYCESCYNVVIERITWDKCGNPNRSNSAGLEFNAIGNVSFQNCTFQRSQVSAVAIQNMSGNVTVNHCNFLSNVKADNTLGGLRIEKQSRFGYVAIFIHDTNFDKNYYGDFSSEIYSRTYGLKVVDRTFTSIWNVIISNTNFSNFYQSASITIYGPNTNITLTGVSVHNNTGGSDIASVFYLKTNTGNGRLLLSILSSKFTGNNGTLLYWSCFSPLYLKASIVNSTFANNNSSYTDSVVSIHVTTDSEESGIGCKYELTNVMFLSNVIPPYIPNMYNKKRNAAGILSILSSKNSASELILTHVSFVSNSNSNPHGGAVYFQCQSSSIQVIKSTFINNKSVQGATLYFDDYQSTTSQKQFHSVLIDHTNFNYNVAEDSIVYFTNLL